MARTSCILWDGALYYTNLTCFWNESLNSIGQQSRQYLRKKKPNNHISPQHIEHKKDQNIWSWEIKVQPIVNHFNTFHLKDY
jgi:hypothetical protein